MPTVEELERKVAELEAALKVAREQVVTAERRLGEQLMGDLVELARRARTEFQQRWNETHDPKLNHLEHHATAYEFVAWQIKNFLEKREKAEREEREKADEAAAAAPTSAPSRFDMIDID